MRGGARRALVIVPNSLGVAMRMGMLIPATETASLPPMRGGSIVEVVDERVTPGRIDVGIAPR